MKTKNCEDNFYSDDADIQVPDGTFRCWVGVSSKTIRLLIIIIFIIKDDDLSAV